MTNAERSKVLIVGLEEERAKLALSPYVHYSPLFLVS